MVLLDARSAARYRGDEEPLDPAAGHIPTARNAPYEANLGELHRFLPPEELAACLASKYPSAGPFLDDLLSYQRFLNGQEHARPPAGNLIRCLHCREADRRRSRS